MRIRAYSIKIATFIGGATLLAGSALTFGASGVGAQAPGSPPAVRYYGSATVNGSPAPSGATVAAQSASSPSTSCGQGQVGSNGSYFVDIQGIAGCQGNVSFTVNGAKASQTGTAPSNPGSAARLDLTVAAAATVVATPPPPPIVRAAAPPPPPAAPVVPAAPPNTGVGPGPARPVAQAPAARAPVSQAPAAAAPRLPNTGTGGLLQSPTQDSVSPWALLSLVVAATILLGSARLALRRTR